MSEPRQARLRVVVAGGGLAGMAAAAALDSHCDVTLVESRRALGGRASSFEDPESGELLDNCQHVLLGCCTNLLDLYRRLGVAGRITWHRTIHFRRADGRRHNLFGVRPVPAPLNMAPAFAGFGLLTVKERFALSRAMLAMLRMGRAGRQALADVSFGDWLKEHGQTAELVRKFYDPVLISALNESSLAASAKYAIQVFQDALLAHSAGYPMGLPNCPLEELYRNLPCRNVRLNTRVAEMVFGGADAMPRSMALRTAQDHAAPAQPRVVGVKLANGEMLAADAVILATNHHAVQRWIPAEIAAGDGRFAQLAKLEAVPILGAHLTFDRPVMSDSHAALVDPPLQWLFRKDREGRILHGVISAARDWPAIPKADALARFERQIQTLFPRSGAKLVRGVIVIEKRATFSPLPGSDVYRPTQGPPVGGIGNLFLAGDYTKTGWPATMEGAVRSGYLAAEAVLAGLLLQTPTPTFLRPDLPLQWPARLLDGGCPK